MTRKEGLALLTRCADAEGIHWSGGYTYTLEECPCCNGTNDSGWLHVPCSRYGSTSRECAPVAWRVSYLIAKETGGPITFELLDSVMSQVVNDSDDPAYIVNNYGHGDYGRKRW